MSLISNELLRDQALILCRNNNKLYGKWTQFKNNFGIFSLPPMYSEKLDDKTRRSVQKPQDLMRHSYLSEE